MKVLILVLALVLSLQSQIATADISYPVLYVRSNGLPSWPCGTSVSAPCKNIATAVANANVYATTTIKVAQGEYAEQIYIVDTLPADVLKQLAIEGGWNADFTVQSSDPSLTRLTSPNDNAVLSINLDVLESVDLRLAYLSFQGITDVQRRGLQALAINSTIDLVLEHCRVASFRGQGILLYADAGSAMTVTVHDTTIQGNYQRPVETPWPGAGLSATAYGGSTLDLTMTKNRIVDNQASSGGGVYFATNGATLNAGMENNILAENQALSEGGAVAVAVGVSGTMELTMTNNTIINNQAATKADGLSLYTNEGTIEAFLKNTIVWEEGTDIFMEKAGSSTLSLVADYSIFGEVINVNGTYEDKSSNLHVDPLVNAEYHLTGASPAKDKGLCGLTLFFGHYSRIAPYDDIDGDLRPGDGTILGCDIGADEYRFPWILFNPAFTRHQ